MHWGSGNTSRSTRRSSCWSCPCASSSSPCSPPCAPIRIALVSVSPRTPLPQNARHQSSQVVVRTTPPSKPVYYQYLQFLSPLPLSPVIDPTLLSIRYHYFSPTLFCNFIFALILKRHLHVLQRGEGDGGNEHSISGEPHRGRGGGSCSWRQDEQTLQKIVTRNILVACFVIGALLPLP